MNDTQAQQYVFDVVVVGSGAGLSGVPGESAPATAAGVCCCGACCAAAPPMGEKLLPPLPPPHAVVPSARAPAVPRKKVRRSSRFAFFSSLMGVSFLVNV